ncbi:MAG: hypothetical protein FK732_01845, partial [Asgard group archaeon]|nr:hypothetical protein [Asgard group archaeon]
MTHFYIQLATNNDTPKSDKIKKVFLGEFRESKILEKQKCVVFVADFIKDNFKLDEKDIAIKFRFNIKKGDAISETSKEKQMNYSPEILVNNNKNEITIKTDPAGTDLIYISVLENGRIVIASHMKYLVSMHPELLNELDYEALIEYLFCHSTLGIKTFFKNIKLLPCNSKIIISNWDKKSQKAFQTGLEQKQELYSFPKDYI